MRLRHQCVGRAWGMGPRGHDSTEMKPGSCERVTAKWIVVCGEQPYVNMQAAATSLPQAVAQGVRPTGWPIRTRSGRTRPPRQW